AKEARPGSAVIDHGPHRVAHGLGCLRMNDRTAGVRYRRGLVVLDAVTALVALDDVGVVEVTVGGNGASDLGHRQRRDLEPSLAEAALGEQIGAEVGGLAV